MIEMLGSTIASASSDPANRDLLLTLRFRVYGDQQPASAVSGRLPAAWTFASAARVPQPEHLQLECFFRAFAKLWNARWEYEGEEQDGAGGK